MRALNIAATGMLAQELNVEVISNNIANLNTTAFKRQRAEFQDLLYQDQRPVGAQSSDNGTLVPVGVQVGSGVKAAAVYRITQQGTLLSTNNPLDIAIQGRGYFQVQMPDGTTAYTRAGSLQLSATGEIVTADGFIVDPGITLPNNTVAVTINASGQVLAQIAGQATPQTVGQFQLAAFPNAQAAARRIAVRLIVRTNDDPRFSGKPYTCIRFRGFYFMPILVEQRDFFNCRRPSIGHIRKNERVESVHLVSAASCDQMDMIHRI